MKLSELIKELEEIQSELIDLMESLREDETVDIDPIVIVASDEEGNEYHELMQVEVDSDGIFLYPGGYELELE